MGSLGRKAQLEKREAGRGQGSEEERDLSSWHSSACCSPAPASAQLSVERFGCRRCQRQGLLSLFQSCLALGVGWAGTKGWQIPTEGTNAPETRARD